jgi:hypothetical protein
MALHDQRSIDTNTVRVDDIGEDSWRKEGTRWKGVARRR